MLFLLRGDYLSDGRINRLFIRHTETKCVTLVMNLTLLEAKNLPTAAVCDFLVSRVEVTSWPAAVVSAKCVRRTASVTQP